MKRFSFILLGFFCALFILIGFIPSLISTSWGTSYLVSVINQKIPGYISCQSLALSWLGPQEIKGLALKSPSELTNPDPVVNSDHIIIERGLIPLLLRIDLLSDIVIKNFVVHLKCNEEGVSNLEEALGKSAPSPIYADQVVTLNQIQINTVESSSESYVLQMTGKSNLEANKGSINVNLSIPNQELPQTLNNEINAHVELKSFPVIFIDLLAFLSADTPKGFFIKTMGVCIEADATQKSLENAIVVDFVIHSQKLRAEATLRVDDTTIALSGPATAAYDFSPEILSDYVDFISIDSSTKVNLEVRNLKIPLKNNKRWVPDEVQLKLTALPFTAHLNDSKQEIDVKEIAIDLKTIDQKTLELTVNASGSSYEAPVQFQFTSQLETSDQFFIMHQKTVADIQTDLISLNAVVFPFQINHRGVLTSPIHMALNVKNSTVLPSFDLTLSPPKESLFKMQEQGLSFDGEVSFVVPNTDPALPILLGKSIQSQFHYSLHPSDAFKSIFTFSLTGEELKMKGALNADTTITIAADRPLSFDYTLTPQRFAALKHLHGYVNNQTALISPGHIHGQISNLSLPLTTPSISFQTLGIKADATIDKIKTHSAVMDQGINLENMVLTFMTPENSNSLSIKFTGQQSGASTKDGILFEANVEDLFKPDGSLNIAGVRLGSTVQVRQLPGAAFAEILGLEEFIGQSIEALVGKRVDAELNLTVQQLTGAMQLSIKGDNGNAFVDATIKNGDRTLVRPLTAEVKATPELAQTILQEIIPVLSGLKSSDQPLKIIIDSVGFHTKVYPFDIKSLQIESGKIELGKLNFANSSQLADILSLLKTGSADSLSVWFTPIYLSINRGVFNLERVDMLINDRYPVAAWGKVDLPKDQVNMKIGLTGESLIHAFNLFGLAPDYMMVFSLKGSTSDAKIDKKQATARISALIAQLSGTPQGIILGTAIDLVSGNLGVDAYPPPTTQPFPWTTSTTTPKEPQTQDDKGSTKQPLKPIKKLGETTGQLLESILG